MKSLSLNHFDVTIDLEQSEDLAGKRIFYYTGSRPQFKANGGWLIAAFAVLYMGLSTEEAYNLVAPLGPYLPFRDASMAMTNTFKLTVSVACQAFSGTAEDNVYHRSSIAWTVWRRLQA